MTDAQTDGLTDEHNAELESPDLERRMVIPTMCIRITEHPKWEWSPFFINVGSLSYLRYG